MNRLKYFALAALVAFAACDEGDEVVVPDPVTGSITGTVTVDGAGLAGVTVTLSSGTSATTGSNGSFTFSGVEAGAYTVSISGTPSDAAFGTTSQAAVIATAGEVISLSFEGSFIRTSAISASISVPGVGALSGATISISGQASDSEVTGASGTVTFSGLRAGSYTVSIVLSSADAALYDLASSSQAVTLDVDELEAVAFTATPKTISTISGRLFLDEASKNNTFDPASEDNLSVANIAIIIEGVSVGVFDTIQTAADGTYSLTGLPAANYRVALQTGDPQIPGAVTFSADSDPAPVISLGVADTEVIDFPFDITTQTVNVSAFLGADEDNGPAGVASRVTPLAGATVTIYPTTILAQAAAGGSLGVGSTGADGSINISFARAADTDPFGGPSDNVVFAVVTGGIGGTLAQNGETIIEIPFAAKDSATTSADAFDYLQTDITIGVRIEEIDNDRYADLIAAVDNTDNGVFAEDVLVDGTDSDGLVYFDVSGIQEYAMGVAAAQTNLPLPGLPIPGAAFSVAAIPDQGSVDTGTLEFDYDGTSLVGDTIFLGTLQISWDVVDIVGRMHHETNDEGTIPTYEVADEGLDFTVPSNQLVQLQREVSAGVWANTGGAINPNIAGGDFTNNGAPSGFNYRYIASAPNPPLYAVLDEDTVTFAVDGADQVQLVCPLLEPGETESFPTCSTFASKIQNLTVSGNVLYRDGTTVPNGTQIQISVDPMTIQGRASSIGDTVVTTTAGFFTTNNNVREGFYTVTAVDDGREVIFDPAVNGEPKDVELRGFATVYDVDADGDDPDRGDDAATSANGQNVGMAAFHAYNGETSIEGVVVNDRDGDDTTIDPGEALVGATVELFFDDNNAFTETTPVATATTDVNGSYSFSDLLEGTYRVRITAPGGEAVVPTFLEFTTEAAFPDLGDDSPAQLPAWDYALNDREAGTEGIPAVPQDVNAEEGTQFAWLHTNGTARGSISDGAAVESITVTIRRCDDETGNLGVPAGDWTPQDGITCDNLDAEFPFQNFVTGADGLYSFTDLREGIYQVSVIPASAGYTGATTGVDFLILINGDNDLEIVNWVVTP